VVIARIYQVSLLDSISQTDDIQDVKRSNRRRESDLLTLGGGSSDRSDPPPWLRACITITITIIIIIIIINIIIIITNVFIKVTLSRKYTTDSQ